MHLWGQAEAATWSGVLSAALVLACMFLLRYIERRYFKGQVETAQTKVEVAKTQVDTEREKRLKVEERSDKLFSDVERHLERLIAEIRRLEKLIEGKDLDILERDLKIIDLVGCIENLKQQLAEYRQKIEEQHGA